MTLGVLFLRMLSRRAHWSAPVNPITIAQTERRARGGEILDLTVSNPTTAGLAYPVEEIAEAFARAARSAYDPAPLGIPGAREAVAQHLGCSAADVVITASTSEAYSYLFKLLADPGDAILTATPSYPLFEHLAALETVELRTFPLEFHRRWTIEPAALHSAAAGRVRAIVVVNPNNPTGSFVTSGEHELLASHGIPIVSDEVFLDYPLQASGVSLANDAVLTFTLGGLSKSAGLPHLKLGWIRVSGPQAARAEAIAGLELIADNFLSVSTPVQVALPDLLRLAPAIRSAIAARARTNLGALHEAIDAKRGSTVLPVEGGWSAVIRVPRLGSDEDLALELLSRGVLVHPGYFFDFDRDGYIVVSLITPEDVFASGVKTLIEVVNEQ